LETVSRMAAFTLFSKPAYVWITYQFIGIIVLT
jgi:hypothetical protein